MSRIDKKIYSLKYAPGWFKDLGFYRWGFYFAQSDSYIDLNIELIREALVFFTFYLIVKMKQLKNILLFWNRPKKLQIFFEPSVPHPWYMVWNTAVWGRVGITKSKEDADLLFYFNDLTEVHPKIPVGSKRTANYHCNDISKSFVARIFKESFGYDLAVDPTSFSGPIVRKSEENAAHDGVIIQGPIVAEPGYSYQKLIDTIDNGEGVDLRCPTVDGEIKVVFIKRRPEKKRFANENSSVVLAMADDVFSVDELKLLNIFCKKMKLDWGGIDVLRDNSDKKIYVVDVNKTDMGPPIDLPLGEKIISTRILSQQLLDLIAKTN